MRYVAVTLVTDRYTRDFYNNPQRIHHAEGYSSRYVCACMYDSLTCVDSTNAAASSLGNDGISVVY